MPRMTSLSRSFLEAAGKTRFSLEKKFKKEYSREDMKCFCAVFFFFVKTMEIINDSKGCNWCSLMGCCGCSVFFHQLPPACPRLSDRSRLQSGQAQQCDSNSITTIPVIINDAAGNIGICSAQEHKALP